MSTRQTHLAALDGLRGMAALIVVISHLSNSTNILNGVLGHGAGKLGVLLFFTLSGFLMVHVTSDKKPTAYEVQSFWFKRVNRVVPLYFFLLILSFAVAAAATAEDVPWMLYPITDLKTLIAHMAMLRGVSVFWTIPVEIAFYAVFPLFWLLRSRPRVLLGTIVGLLVLQWLLDYPRPHYQALRVIHYGHFFLFGILAYLVHERFDRRLADIVFAIGIAGLIASYPAIGLLPDTPFWQSPIMMIAAPAMIASAPHSRIAKEIFSNRIAVFLGSVSYSLYLSHLVVMHYVERFSDLENPYAITAVTLVLAVLVAWALFTLVERPARTGLNRIALSPRLRIRKPSAVAD